MIRHIALWLFARITKLPSTICDKYILGELIEILKGSFNESSHSPPFLFTQYVPKVNFVHVVFGTTAFIVPSCAMINSIFATYIMVSDGNESTCHFQVYVSNPSTTSPSPSYPSSSSHSPTLAWWHTQIYTCRAPFSLDQVHPYNPTCLLCDLFFIM